jgi:hypothetical protein
LKTILKIASIIGILVLLLGGFSTNLAAASASTNLPAITTHSLVPSTPMPDDQVGCYNYANSTGWQSVPCATPAQIQSLPNWTVGGGTYGVNDIYSGGTQLTQVDVAVQFATFAGETDSSSGSNDWSIQANTNLFIGTNGQWDWVQFVFFNYGSYLLGTGQDGVCVSQSVGGSYSRSCNIWYLAPLGLSSTTADTIEGWTSQSGGTHYLNDQFCTTSKCWGETTTDVYGLGVSSWTDGSGTILGMGGGSTATFTHGSSEYTTVYVYAASRIYGSTSVSYETAEMNNLNNGNTFSSCATSSPFYCDYDTYASI